MNFRVKKYDNYILMEFPADDTVYMDTLGEIELERANDLAHELQLLNKGTTVVVRVGDGLTMILNGTKHRLDIERIGEVLKCVE